MTTSAEKSVTFHITIDARKSVFDFIKKTEKFVAQIWFSRAPGHSKSPLRMGMVKLSDSTASALITFDENECKPHNLAGEFTVQFGVSTPRAACTMWTLGSTSISFSQTETLRASQQKTHAGQSVVKLENVTTSNSVQDQCSCTTFTLEISASDAWFTAMEKQASEFSFHVAHANKTIENIVDGRKHSRELAPLTRQFTDVTVCSPAGWVPTLFYMSSQQQQSLTWSTVYGCFRALLALYPEYRSNTAYRHAADRWYIPIGKSPSGDIRLSTVATAAAGRMLSNLTTVQLQLGARYRPDTTLSSDGSIELTEDMASVAFDAPESMGGSGCLGGDCEDFACMTRLFFHAFQQLYVETVHSLGLQSVNTARATGKNRPLDDDAYDPEGFRRNHPHIAAQIAKRLRDEPGASASLEEDALTLAALGFLAMHYVSFVEIVSTGSQARPDAHGKKKKAKTEATFKDEPVIQHATVVLFSYSHAVSILGPEALRDHMRNNGLVYGIHTGPSDSEDVFELTHGFKDNMVYLWPLLCEATNMVFPLIFPDEIRDRLGVDYDANHAVSLLDLMLSANSTDVKKISRLLSTISRHTTSGVFSRDDVITNYTMPITETFYDSVLVVYGSQQWVMTEGASGKLGMPFAAHMQLDTDRMLKLVRTNFYTEQMPAPKPQQEASASKHSRRRTGTRATISDRTLAHPYITPHDAKDTQSYGKRISSHAHDEWVVQFRNRSVYYPKQTFLWKQNSIDALHILKHRTRPVPVLQMPGKVVSSDTLEGQNMFPALTTIEDRNNTLTMVLYPHDVEGPVGKQDGKIVLEAFLSQLKTIGTVQVLYFTMYQLIDTIHPWTSCVIQFNHKHPKEKK